MGGEASATSKGCGGRNHRRIGGGAWVDAHRPTANDLELFDAETRSRYRLVPTQWCWREGGRRAPMALKALVAAVFVVFSLTMPAAAQDWPNRPITLVVP